VDRSYLSSRAGNVQTYLIAAYRAFRLIDEGAHPTAVLLKFADPEVRKGMIADLLRTYYPTIIPLGQTNSTPAQLAEAFAQAFESVTGESRVKAIRFFLAASGLLRHQTQPALEAAKGTARQLGPTPSTQA
jgi:hypothetical protein